MTLWTLRRSHTNKTVTCLCCVARQQVLGTYGLYCAAAALGGTATLASGLVAR
jgi:hypothetical protein